LFHIKAVVLFQACHFQDKFPCTESIISIDYKVPYLKLIWFCATENVLYWSRSPSTPSSRHEVECSGRENCLWCCFITCNRGLIQKWYNVRRYTRFCVCVETLEINPVYPDTTPCRSSSVVTAVTQRNFLVPVTRFCNISGGSNIRFMLDRPRFEYSDKS